MLAVVVAHDPGPWFEETLDSLATQDYSRFSVLVVDASGDGTLDRRVHAALPNASVVDAGDTVGFSAAANAVLDTDVDARLKADGSAWQRVDGALQRRFDFSDYHHTMAFVNPLAWVAHSQDHHPELQLGYAHCTVSLNTHSVGGLSINDFICAARIDALLP